MPSRSASRPGPAHVPPRNRSRRAFTLLEILIWVAVAALAAGVGFGLVVPYAQERKLQSGAERLASALEFAREVARSEGRPVSVRVVPDGRKSAANSAQLRYADNLATVLHPLTKAAYRIDYRNDPGMRGVLVVSSEAGGGDTVQFDTRGEPSGEKNKFTLACGGAQAVVRVEEYSGRVVVEEARVEAIDPD